MGRRLTLRTSAVFLALVSMVHAGQAGVSLDEGMSEEAVKEFFLKEPINKKHSGLIAFEKLKAMEFKENGMTELDVLTEAVKEGQTVGVYVFDRKFSKIQAPQVYMFDQEARIKVDGNFTEENYYVVGLTVWADPESQMFKNFISEQQGKFQKMKDVLVDKDVERFRMHMPVYSGTTSRERLLLGYILDNNLPLDEYVGLKVKKIEPTVKEYEEGNALSVAIRDAVRPEAKEGKVIFEYETVVISESQIKNIEKFLGENKEMIRYNIIRKMAQGENIEVSRDFIQYLIKMDYSKMGPAGGGMTPMGVDEIIENAKKEGEAFKTLFGI